MSDGLHIGVHLLISPDRQVDESLRRRAVRMLRDVAEREGGLELDEESVLYESRREPNGLEDPQTPEAHSSLARYTAYAYPKGQVPQ